MINLDKLNGFLSCIANLNDGPEHFCLYEMSHVPAHGNRRESLIAHLNHAHRQNMGVAVKSWYWEVRLIKADNPAKALSQAIQQHFFSQQYSPQLTGSSCHPTGFADLLMSEFEQRPIKFYQAIADVKDIWHEKWWADYLIDDNGTLYQLHFGATN